jgi:uncharacterized protein (DUF58 family)
VSLPPEILKKVKLLEIQTRKLVNNLFSGEYHTAFKGQGITFSDFREYIPGDDIRSISWTLTARAEKPYIKKFDEERELTLMLAVDISASSDFGSKKYFKGEVINHLAALMSFSAAKNKDRIGLCMFSDQVEHYVPPAKGHGQVNRILRDLYYFKPKHRKTKISSMVEYLQGILKKRATIFLFSDFLDDNFAESLKTFGKKHEVVAVVVRDPLEQNLPDIGLVTLQDPESGETAVVDSSDKNFRAAYAAEMDRRKKRVDEQLLKARVDRIDVFNPDDFVTPLVNFFKGHKKR